jgi:hypothetical protein
MLASMALLSAAILPAPIPTRHAAGAAGHILGVEAEQRFLEPQEVELVEEPRELFGRIGYDVGCDVEQAVGIAGGSFVLHTKTRSSHGLVFRKALDEGVNLVAQRHERLVLVAIGREVIGRSTPQLAREAPAGREHLLGW